jgi:tRNA-splicing ligase RtcB
MTTSTERESETTEARETSSSGWPRDLTLERLDDYRWLIPRQGRMRVDGLIYADDRLIEDIRGDEAVRQVANVACLPGIVGRSLAMPDVHWGYGFAIGGVAAFDPDEDGVISPGGVGYDINCGVRLIRTDLSEDDVRPSLEALMNQVMRDVPAGVGSEYRDFRLDEAELRAVLTTGAAWAVRQGMGTDDDLAHIESGGTLPGADPDEVSARAKKRGRPQLGTVGSGNHFIEIGYVDRVFDAPTAERIGLGEGTVTAFIHSGSRGLGHQVCTDFLDVMQDASRRYGIDLPDRQLACAPLTSPEAARYLDAMAAAANYAFANRQVMTHRVREAFARIFDRSWEDLGMRLVYDVAHNNAKWEDHRVDGETRRLCVHRKGATRAFPPGHPDLPPAYAEVGQPVLIPGDMGRYSYVLVGTEAGYRETFGSTCHGAGRRMSRRQAKRSVRGRNLRKEFEELGIVVRAASFATVAEEIPEAYKDVADVVDVVDHAGIGRKVVRLRPLGVLKG